MDNLNIKTKDITDDFFNLVSSIQGPPTFTLNSEGYKLTDTCAEHEVFEKRADLYANASLQSFDIILDQALLIERTNDLYISLFDSLMYSELLFIEGKPIFNSYYTCVFLHNVDILSSDSVLYSIIGGYIYRLKSIFYLIFNSGVNNHEDFSYTHIPFNNFFDENKLFELIADNEEKFKDSNLKIKS